MAGTSRDFIGFLRVGGSWTAYTPLNGVTMTRNYDTATPNAVILISLVALSITVIAAVVQAVLGRRAIVGVVAVAAPIVGGALILWALYHRAGVAGTVQLSDLIVFALVLVGVAVRGIGSSLDSFVTRPEAASSSVRGGDQD